MFFMLIILYNFLLKIIKKDILSIWKKNAYNLIISDFFMFNFIKIYDCFFIFWSSESIYLNFVL